MNEELKHAEIDEVVSRLKEKYNLTESQTEIIINAFVDNNKFLKLYLLAISGLNEQQLAEAEKAYVKIIMKAGGLIFLISYLEKIAEILDEEKIQAFIRGTFLPILSDFLTDLRNRFGNRMVPELLRILIDDTFIKNTITEAQQHGCIISKIRVITNRGEVLESDRITLVSLKDKSSDLYDGKLSLLPFQSREHNIMVLFDPKDKTLFIVFNSDRTLGAVN